MFNPQTPVIPNKKPKRETKDFWCQPGFVSWSLPIRQNEMRQLGGEQYVELKEMVFYTVPFWKLRQIWLWYLETVCSSLVLNYLRNKNNISLTFLVSNRDSSAKGHHLSTLSLIFKVEYWVPFPLIQSALSWRRNSRLLDCSFHFNIFYINFNWIVCSLPLHP